jgi:hypothetical protein
MLNISLEAKGKSVRSIATFSFAARGAKAGGE